jgi:hypothetical protein
MASASYSFSFESLFRGFVPTSLFTAVRSGLDNNKEATCAILTTISQARKDFKSKVWEPRNLLMHDFEQRHGINDTQKKAKCPRNAVPPTSQPSHKDNRWMLWMTSSLDSDKPWQGFSHTC